MSWFLAGAAALGGISNVLGGKKAKKESRQAANNSWDQTLEEARRLKYQQAENIEAAEYQQSSNIADLGGSGVQQSGTAQAIMDRDTQDIENIQAEDEKQIEWLMRSGKSRADEIRAGGDAAWYQGVLGGVSSGITAWGESMK